MKGSKNPESSGWTGQERSDWTEDETEGRSPEVEDEGKEEVGRGDYRGDGGRR